VHILGSGSSPEIGNHKWVFEQIAIYGLLKMHEYKKIIIQFVIPAATSFFKGVSSIVRFCSIDSTPAY
jgi:hypothetical protein